MTNGQTLSYAILSLAIAGCSATHQTHIYRDLAPRAARGEGCSLELGGEFMEVAKGCELLGDDYYAAAHGGFSCDLSGARSAFIETACSAGATHVRTRIVSPCYEVRAELFDCSSTEGGADGNQSDE